MNQILAETHDSAANNHTASRVLALMDNSYHKALAGTCFNHSINLSAKSVLKPFNIKLNVNLDSDEMPPLEPIGDHGSDEEEFVEDDTSDDGDFDVFGGLSSSDKDSISEEIHPVKNTLQHVSKHTIIVLH